MVDYSTPYNKEAVAAAFNLTPPPPPQSTQTTSTQLGGSGNFGGGGAYQPVNPQSTQVTSTQLGGTPDLQSQTQVQAQSTPFSSTIFGTPSVSQFGSQVQSVNPLYIQPVKESFQAQPVLSSIPMSLNPSGMSYAPINQVNSNLWSKLTGVYEKGSEFLNKVYEASPFNPNRYIESQRFQGYDELGNPIYVTAPTKASLLTATFVGAAPYSLSSVPKGIPLSLASETPQNVAFLGTKRTLGFQGGNAKVSTQLVYQTEKGQFGKFASTSYANDNSLISIGAGKNLIGGRNNFVGFSVGQSKETPVIIGRDVSAYPVISIYKEFPGAKGLNYGQVLNKEGATTFLSGGVEAQSKGVNALIGKVYTKGGQGTYAGLLRTGTSDFSTIDNSLIGRSTQQAISQARANLPLTKTTTKAISQDIRPITSLITTSDIKPITPKTESKLSQSLVSDQSIGVVTTQNSAQSQTTNNLIKTTGINLSISGTQSDYGKGGATQSELTIQPSKEIQRENSLLLFNQPQLEAQRQPSLQVNKEFQQQRQTQNQVQPSILKEGGRFPNTPFTLPTLSSGKSKLTLKNVSDAFIAITKRRGKLIELGRFKTPQEAFSKSEQIALGTLARRVEVIRASTGKPVELTSLPSFLRPAKREKGVYIQKNALSARSEVSEILSAKRGKATLKGRRLKL